MNGLIARKIGMTQIFDQDGRALPVTVLEAGPCVVTQIKKNDSDGYAAVQIGFGKSKKIKKPQAGHLKGIEEKPKHLKELRYEKTENIEKGQKITVEIFKVGDVVRICGKSIGKGFAGTVKRWNFGRGPMSHGSKSHRLPGSIGAGTTPARVFKGLKMAGRMGNKTVTEKKEIVMIDKEKNLLLVRGSVVGAKNNILLIEKNG